MYRPIPLEEVIASMPKKRQEAIAKRGAELVAKVKRRMTLAELRKGRKISQATVAEALGIGQMQISRLEKRKDPRLSTMARTVAAMGGHLTMIATFPDQESELPRSVLSQVPKCEAPGAPIFSGCAHFSRHLGHPQHTVIVIPLRPCPKTRSSR
jgi:transcriptional regulator with XRE-family HTH domain